MGHDDHHDYDAAIDRADERQPDDAGTAFAAAIIGGLSKLLAMLDWNALEARARYHGITFSVTAQAHHRAAVLDYLDNPDAPTLISGKHLSWLAPINVYATDPTRHAKNWDRYFAMCQPMQNRDFDHDHAVRARLMG